jgi:hypothetical protein
LTRKGDASLKAGRMRLATGRRFLEIVRQWAAWAGLEFSLRA